MYPRALDCNLELTDPPSSYFVNLVSDESTWWHSGTLYSAAQD